MPVSIELNCPEHFRNKARYVLDTFFEALRLEGIERMPDAPSIAYGPSEWSHRVVLIEASEEAFHYFQQHKEYDTDQVVFSRQDDARFPILFPNPATDAFITVKSPGVVHIHQDIIASAFFFLSCWQETTIQERDPYGRFPYHRSMQAKLGITTQPVVNDYLNVLKRAIEMCLESDGQRYEWQPYWGARKSFGIFLTHDIDTVQKWNWRTIRGEVKHWGGLALKHHSPIKAVQRTAKVLPSIIGPSDPYWNFEDIMQVEEAYGFRSTFFFMAGGTHPLDGKYPIHTGKMKRLFEDILNRGHEIGLHGSFDSYDKLDELAVEKEALESIVGSVRGIRQHYLRFDVQRTWAIQEKLGFEYDTTLGFAEHEGFRAGYCLPFHPYNLTEDRPYALLERPLVVMDGTLSNYRKLPATRNHKSQIRNSSSEISHDAWQSLAFLMDTVRRYGGELVLLFHNSHLDAWEHDAWWRVYERLLRRARRMSS